MLQEARIGKYRKKYPFSAGIASIFERNHPEEIWLRECPQG
jgi:hypothetical protein